jgi:hypothetical protein
MNTATLTGAQSRPAASWLFVLSWTLISVISFAVQGWVFHYPGDLYNPATFTPLGFPIALYGALLRTFAVSAATFGLLLATVTGAVLTGLPQWLLLRRLLPLSAWWIAAVALGIGVTHGLVDGFAAATVFLLPFIMLASGVILGVLQWQVTRRHVARAVWWIPVSALGWYLAWLLGAQALNASGLLGQEWTPVVGSQQHGLFSAVFGLVYGALSGVFWLYLLRLAVGEGRV